MFCFVLVSNHENERERMKGQNERRERTEVPHARRRRPNKEKLATCLMTTQIIKVRVVKTTMQLVRANISRLSWLGIALQAS